MSGLSYTRLSLQVTITPIIWFISNIQIIYHQTQFSCERLVLWCRNTKFNLFGGPPVH
jgi:hypothetical protein